MSETTEQLLRRAAEKITKQSATIRELRGDDTLAGAITKSLSPDAMHLADAGGQLIAQAIREGSKNSYRKAVNKVGFVTPDEAMRKQRDKRDLDGPPKRDRDNLPSLKDIE